MPFFVDIIRRICYYLPHMRKLETIISWAVKIGLFAVPFVPVFVSPVLLFPFITGKNFAFRIGVEALFVLWVWLAIVSPDYRPRLTRLFKVTTIFIAIVFFADLFGPNPYRSFFSNYERMEGFMMIGHLYLYFLMMFSMFRKRDWTVFFHTTLIASLWVSLIGLIQKLGYRISIQGGFRVDSTIGNPTYLAAYLLFHFWILLILLYMFRRKWWAVALYGAALIFELLIIYFTATRGAIVALVVIGTVCAAAVAAFWPLIFPPEVSKKTGSHDRARWPWGRKIAVTILAVVIVVPAILLLARNSGFVHSSPVLRRVTNYSLHEGTIQARFKIWGMSLQGFRDRPILGWGQENYYLVFQKYFNPALYTEEPWFDRSHNIFFDWLIHAGILGLASYLSIYAVVIWGLARGMKDRMVPFWNGLIVIAALLAHFLQNVFVFDNLNTYIPFFAFVAYAGFLMNPDLQGKASAKPAIKNKSIYGKAHAVTLVLAVVTLWAGYYLHIKPLRQSKALINALQAYQYKAPMDTLINSFNEALAYDSFGATEVREQMGNISRSVLNADHFKPEEKKAFIDRTIEEFEKETNHSAKDVKHMLVLGSLLDAVLTQNPEYPIKARAVLEEAVKLSPGKQMLAVELAQFYLLAGDGQSAVNELYRSWKLEPKNHEIGIHLWVIGIAMNQKDVVKEVSTAFIGENLSETDLFRIQESYRRVNDYASALIYSELLVTRVSDNAKYRTIYAALLANAGRFAEARNQAQKAVELDPNMKSQAETFLKLIEGR